MDKPTSLFEALAWVLSGGAGIAIYAIWEWLSVRVPGIEEIAPHWKRDIVVVLSASLAMIAYAVMVALGYSSSPVGVKGWLESMFLYGLVGAVSSQVAHGHFSLAKKRTGHRLR